MTGRCLGEKQFHTGAIPPRTAETAAEILPVTAYLGTTWQPNEKVSNTSAQQEGKAGQ